MVRHRCGLGLLSLACFTPMAAGQCGPFFSNASVVGQLVATPSDLQAVDLDRDGNAELIFAARGNASAGISILKASNAGVPQVIQTLPQSSTDTTIKFQVADVNRDGILDMLVTQFSTGSVRVYLGLGNGTFNTSPSAFAVGANPAAFVCADLNNDGKLDLVVTNTLDGAYSVLMGNGDGTFQPRVATAAGIASANQISLADFNGDGRLDLVLAGGPFAVAIAMGNGNGTFAAATTYASAIFPASTPTLLRVSDLNGDGVPDIVISINSADKLLVMMGRPNGTFAPEKSVDMPLNSPSVRAFSLADFNLDGKPDLMVVQGDVGSLSYPVIMLNTGDGTFATQLKWNEINPSGGTTASTTADLNRDGLQDIAYVDRFGQLVTMTSTSGGPVRLVFGQANQVFPAGWNIGFSALAEGAGVTYAWFKDGQPILNSPRVYADGRTMAINNLQASDSGIYQCKISNTCGSITTTSYVHVLPASNPCPVDFDGDGFITFEDFDAYVRAFEEGC